MSSLWAKIWGTEIERSPAAKRTGAAAGLLIAILLAVLLFGVHGVSRAGEGGPPAESLKRVALIPQWQPQAQFAGYYVALEKGFYRDQGMEVTILQGGPDRPSAEWVRTGAAQFATLFLSTAILERSKGTRLVNLGQIVQVSSQLLIAKRASGIQSLQAMDGRKVGLWAAELSILPTALFRKLGVHPTIIPQSSTVNLFLKGGVDVASAMWYNEYHTILSAGMDPEDLVVFRLSDTMSFPEDGIYCLDTTYRSDPDMCCRFVRASLLGWRYAFDHEEEALDIVMKVVDGAQIATNRVHQKWMLRCMRELVKPVRPGGALGTLAEADYQAVASQLQASGLMTEGIPMTDFRVDCAGAHEK
ncbi:MAG: ABC transporter substrate-binding protein [Syntrophobacteraceae bacterium]